MKNKLTIPLITVGSTHSGELALLLTIGAPTQWPVLISPADFDLVTQITGHRAWGIHGRNVVVGDPNHVCGRRAVARIIAGIQDAHHLRPAFRDGNPLNLMRSNLGIRGQASSGIFWLHLRPGEADPIHFDGAWPQTIPESLYRHRKPVRPPRDPSQAGLPPHRQHWTQRHA